MNDLEQIDTLSIHGATYVITTSVHDGSMLQVEAEQDGRDGMWIGRFSEAYIEDITQKAGNRKKFDVFVQMLTAALAQRSDSVFVDLLTYQDLETLKTRRAGHASHSVSSSSTAVRGNNKRYLILTYAVEFDRVHYPLPLAYEEEPSPQALMRTVRRLREELSHRPPPGSAGNTSTEGAASHQAALTHLRQENAALRQQVKQMAGQAQAHGENGAGGGGTGASPGHRRLRRQLEELQARLDDLTEEHRQLRADSSREIRRLKREARQGGSADGGASGGEEVLNLRHRVAALHAEVAEGGDAMKRMQAKHKGELAALTEDLDREMANGTALRAKLRDAQRRILALEANAKPPAGPRATPRRGGARRPRAASLSRTSEPGGAWGGTGRAFGARSESPRDRQQRYGRAEPPLSLQHTRAPASQPPPPRPWSARNGTTTRGQPSSHNGAVRPRPTRTDSPRGPRVPPPSARSSTSLGGRPPSRTNSPAADRSRARSRSVSSSRGAFDPTAYQQEKEEKLRRAVEDRRRRERRGIMAGSPNTSRDSWIPHGVEPGGRSGGAAARRSRESGYTSAGSAASSIASRASKRSVRSASQRSDASERPKGRRRPRPQGNGVEHPAPPAPPPRQSKAPPRDRAGGPPQRPRTAGASPAPPRRPSPAKQHRPLSATGCSNEVLPTAVLTQAQAVMRTRLVRIKQPVHDSPSSSTDDANAEAGPPPDRTGPTAHEGNGPSAQHRNGLSHRGGHSAQNGGSGVVLHRETPPGSASTPARPRQSTESLGQDGAGPEPEGVRTSQPGAPEISDIDRRLNALQDFLKQAKAGLVPARQPA